MIITDYGETTSVDKKYKKYGEGENYRLWRDKLFGQDFYSRV
jgi:hypothetical protein